MRCDARSSKRKTLGNEQGSGLIEALVAVMILAFGLLAVTGLTMATAAQARLAQYQTEQALAGQQALAATQQQAFSEVADTTRSIAVGERTFVVTVTVSPLSTRVKVVQAEVSGVGTVGSRFFSTKVYARKPLPSGS